MPSAKQPLETIRGTLAAPTAAASADRSTSDKMLGSPVSVSSVLENAMSDSGANKGNGRYSNLSQTNDPEKSEIVALFDHVRQSTGQTSHAHDLSASGPALHHTHMSKASVKSDYASIIQHDSPPTTPHGSPSAILSVPVLFTPVVGNPNDSSNQITTAAKETSNSLPTETIIASITRSLKDVAVPNDPSSDPGLLSVSHTNTNSKLDIPEQQTASDVLDDTLTAQQASAQLTDMAIPSEMSISTRESVDSTASERASNTEFEPPATAGWSSSQQQNNNHASGSTSANDNAQTISLPSSQKYDHNPLAAMNTASVTEASSVPVFQKNKPNTLGNVNDGKTTDNTSLPLAQNYENDVFEKTNTAGVTGPYLLPSSQQSNPNARGKTIPTDASGTSLLLSVQQDNDYALAKANATQSRKTRPIPSSKQASSNTPHDTNTSHVTETSPSPSSRQADSSALGNPNGPDIAEISLLPSPQQANNNTLNDMDTTGATETGPLPFSQKTSIKALETKDTTDTAGMSTVSLALSPPLSPSVPSPLSSSSSETTSVILSETSKSSGLEAPTSIGNVSKSGGLAACMAAGLLVLFITLYSSL